MANGTINTPVSVNGPEVAAVIAQAKADAAASPPRTITVGGSTFATPFASPEDWRDRWIYFLLVDRFNNPTAPPIAPDPSLPYQGGNFEGILNDTEIVVVANANKDAPVTTQVQVDANLTPPGRVLRLLFSNLDNAGATAPGAAVWTSGCSVVPVTLRPMEAQVLG